jgi:hypothetical protein
MRLSCSPGTPVPVTAGVQFRAWRCAAGRPAANASSICGVQHVLHARCTVASHLEAVPKKYKGSNGLQMHVYRRCDIESHCAVVRGEHAAMPPTADSVLLSVDSSSVARVTLASPPVNALHPKGGTRVYRCKVDRKAAPQPHSRGRSNLRCCAAASTCAQHWLQPPSLLQ